MKRKDLEYKAATILAQKKYQSKIALAKTLAGYEKAKAEYDIEIGDIVSEFSNDTPLATFVELDPLLIIDRLLKKSTTNILTREEV